MNEKLVSSDGTDAVSVAILDVVVELIEERGYDGVELKPVAQRAHVSLATIYNRFSSRDGLLLAAVEHWMGKHAYRPLRAPDPAVTTAERLTEVFRQIFRPWVRHPRMLEAFIRARQAGGASRLFLQGRAAVEPVVRACFDEDADPAFVAEVSMVLGHVAYSVLSHVATGSMSAKQVLPVFEAAVRRLTATADVAPVRRRRGTSR